MVSPVIPTLAAFAFGVLVLQSCATLPPRASLILAGAVVAFASATWRSCRAAKSTRPAPVATIVNRCVVIATAGVTGFGYAAWRADSRLSDALSPQWEGTDIRIVGVIDDLPQFDARGVRFAFAVEEVLTPRAHVPARISLGWQATSDEQSDDAPTEVHAGERWRLVVRLKRPHGTVNPDGFDLEAWLLERNLRATGYVRTHDANARLAPFVGRAGDYVQRARERVRSRIQEALPGRPYAGVLIALAIGDQRAIPESQWLVFNRTGVSHLISISGLHVTVFAALAGGVAYLVTRRFVPITSRVPARKVSAAIGLAAAYGYVLLAGCEVPAVRTLLMLAVGALGLWLGRPGTAPVVWLWSLVVVLIWDPWASLSPGMWLSFGAVGLLLYAGAGRLARSPPRLRRQRAILVLREAARTQWIVTIGLVPGTLALFQQVSLVSGVANAIAIPAVTLAIVPLALCGIAVPLDAIWQLAHALLAILMAALEMLSQLPSAVWAQHAPASWTVVVAVLGILVLLAPRGVPGRSLGSLGLVPLVAVTPPQPTRDAFRLTALDVGQGLAVLIQTSRHALLYDTGPRFGATADAGGRIIAPFLRAAGIRALDALIVSHQDIDHSGGALSLMQTVPVATLWSSLPVESPIVSRASAGGSSWRCAGGQAWTWDGVRFSILSPPIGQFAQRDVKTNDQSCVLRVDSPYGSALIAGDIEARSEGRLVSDPGAELRADALVVPHHGSRTSSTAAFVDAVHPRVAIFSIGYRNRFGHPRADVVARYQSIGAIVMRSDTHGAVTLEFGPAGAPVPIAERDRRRRYWYDG